MVVASGALEVSGDCHRDKPGSDYENETRAAGMSYIHIVLCPPGPRVAMDTEKGMPCIVALAVVFLRGSEGSVSCATVQRGGEGNNFFERFFAWRRPHAGTGCGATHADDLSKSIKNE